MKSHNLSIICLIFISGILFNSIAFSDEIESNNISSDYYKTDPKWLKRLTYRQRLTFNKCPSIKNIAKYSEGTRSKNFDYYAQDPTTLKWKGLVEGAHFTVGVQQGKYGNAGTLEGDLDYVLRHFPNHPKALYVMGKLQAKDHFNPKRGSDRKDYFIFSIECYLNRAIQLNNKYSSTYLVSAILLHQSQSYSKAELHYLKATELDSKNTEAQYNLGLLYFDIKEYEKSKVYAIKAYAGGYPLSGLKDKLKSLNKW